MKYFFLYLVIVICISFSARAEHCDMLDLTTAEYKRYEDPYKINAVEIKREEKKIACLKEEIQDYTVANYGIEKWRDLNKSLADFEEHYLNTYKIVRCVQWPQCSGSGEVFPHIDYYMFLKKLLADLKNPTNSQFEE